MQSVAALVLHHDAAVAEAAMDVLLEYSTRKQGTSAGNRSDVGVAQAAAAVFRMACRGMVRRAAPHAALLSLLPCIVAGNDDVNQHLHVWQASAQWDWLLHEAVLLALAALSQRQTP